VTQDISTLTIETVVDVGSLIERSGNIDAAENFIDDIMDIGVIGLPDSIKATLDLSLDEFEEMSGREFREVLAEIISEYCYRSQTHGQILVQFATPFFSSFSKGNYASFSSYSWGHYYTRWVWANNLEEAWKLGAEWAIERKEADRQRSFSNEEDSGSSD